MKRNIIIGVFILLFLVVCFICIRFIPFGTQEATMGANIQKIEIPNLSSLESECCKYEATFNTLRGKSSIQKELDNMVSNYMEMDCNGKKAYYDMTHNVTIFEYEVKSSGLFTKFTIKYNIGRTCE